MITAVMFDFGHTIADELKSRDIPLRKRPIHLMPGVIETLPRVGLPIGLWCNSRRAKEPGLRHWLKRAGLNQYFRWVVTSVDAGYRKPAREFFDYAVAHSGLRKEEILFVGNQLNSDILGAHRYGIENVWLSGAAHRSPDDTLSIGEVTPDHTIEALAELPGLLTNIATVKLAP